ncbi:hypothetical protein GCM10020358_08440 [Amorphoplanes nipponensis]
MPATLLPTVTTANSPGAVSRATMVCSRSTTAAASTTGSTPRCGIAPCEPWPNTVILMLSPADRTGPGRQPRTPASWVSTCWAKATSGRGIRLVSPSSSMACAPAAVSSAGWKSAMNVPRQAARSPLSSAAAPSRQVMWTSCPQACETPTVAPDSSTAVTFDAYGSAVSSVTGRASMSARTSTVRPPPLVRTPTTPPPMCCTS